MRPGKSQKKLTSGGRQKALPISGDSADVSSKSATWNACMLILGTRLTARRSTFDLPRAPRACFLSSSPTLSQPTWVTSPASTTTVRAIPPRRRHPFSCEISPFRNSRDSRARATSPRPRARPSARAPRSYRVRAASPETLARLAPRDVAEARLKPVFRPRGVRFSC